jgi:hypothetical protein
LEKFFEIAAENVSGMINQEHSIRKFWPQCLLGILPEPIYGSFMSSEPELILASVALSN